MKELIKQIRECPNIKDMDKDMMVSYLREIPKNLLFDLSKQSDYQLKYHGRLALLFDWHEVPPSWSYWYFMNRRLMKESRDLKNEPKLNEVHGCDLSHLDCFWSNKYPHGEGGYDSYCKPIIFDHNRLRLFHIDSHIKDGLIERFQGTVLTHGYDVGDYVDEQGHLHIKRVYKDQWSTTIDEVEWLLKIAPVVRRIQTSKNDFYFVYTIWFKEPISYEDLTKILNSKESDNILTKGQMRDYIIRVHEMSTGNYVQDDTELKKRIGALCEKAIEADEIMKGFLGRGGEYAERDLLKNNSLDD